MFKKFLFFLFILFQTSPLLASQFNFNVYALNLNFMQVKFDMNNNKIFSVIESKGLVGHFVSFKTIIQTTFLDNKVRYFFKEFKKNKDEIYEFETVNGKVIYNSKKIKKNSQYKKIEIQDLKDTVDPLTGVRDMLFGQKTKLNCSLKQKIYDGDDVYEVYFKPIKKLIKEVVIEEKKYPIHQACSLNYKAISGHKLSREKDLNSRYLNVYFAKQEDTFVPVYFDTKLKILSLKMQLSTIVKP
jgi:hypothetical protein